MSGGNLMQYANRTTTKNTQMKRFRLPHALVEQLAAVEGQTMTDFVIAALREKFEREQSSKS
jgi:uncharacterized protein (DUF1778 family)